MISETDFIDFYQFPINRIYDREEEVDLFNVMGYAYENPYKYEWFEKALSSIWRLLEAKIVVYEEDIPNDELLKRIVEPCNSLYDRSDYWERFTFKETKLVKLVEEVEDTLLPMHYRHLCSELYNKLSKIFDDAGVGFDKKCHYKIPKEKIR